VTNTAELITEVDAVQAAIADSKTQAGQALSCAEDLAGSAAAHGWEGVAASTREACDALEEVSASLDTAEQATEAAVNVLNGITDQMSSGEVAQVLATTGGELDQAGTALAAATDSVDEAWQAAQRAGEPSELMDLLQGLRDSLDQTRRGLEDIKGKIDTERQEAYAWGN
jgi:hypothetical protein